MKGWLLSLLLSVSIIGFSQPVITSFSPLKGPVGATVTITGSNFNTTPSNNIVFFGATKATVSIASSTQLTVTVPQGATHESITVTNLATSLTAYAKTPFLPTFNGVNNTVFSASSFASPVNLPARALSYTIIVNDMNGDGKPDLAVLNTIGAIGANVNVYKNNSSTGTLSFDPKVDYSPGLYFPYDLVMADLDGDGKKDMALLGDGSFVAYRNISTSSIAFEEKGSFTTGARSHVILSGDINGDGKPDIVTSSVFSNSVSVLINTTVGSNISFAPQMTLLVNNGYYAAFYLALADIDGDGKLDIITTDKDNNTLTVLRNTSSGGTASFAPKSFLAASSEPSTLSAHDIDGDGKPDLAYISGNNLVVLRNVGTPGNIQFAAAVTYTGVAITNYDIFNIAFNDMDGDGNPDILLTNGNILKNNSTPGNISLAAKVNFPGGGMAVEAGDLDGDGKPELILTNSDEVVAILRNTTPSVPVLTNVTISSSNATVKKAKTGDIVTVTFTASEQISLPAVSIAGHAVTATNTTNNTWSAPYTMQPGDAEGNISFQVNFGGVGGTSVTSTTDNSLVYFDKTVPTVITSNRSLPVAAITKAPLLIYRVTFSEPVTNVTTTAFQISPTGTASGTVMAVTAVSASQYDVTVSGVSGNGSIRLDVKSSGSGIIDSTGNILAGGFTTGQLFTIDQTAKPTLNSLNLSSNNVFSNAQAKVGDLVTASFATSEPVTTPVVTIGGHLVPVSNTTGNNWKATYTMISADTEGAIALFVAFTDVSASIAAIPVTTTLDASAVTFDKTAPTVTAISRLTPLTATAITNTALVFRAVFSETVTGITANAFQLTTTGTVTATIASVSAFSGNSVDITVNVTNSVGTLRLDLKSSGTGITDNAGNPMVAGYSAGQVYTLDQVTQAPVLTSPVAWSTNYVGFTLTGSMPENYLPGSAKLFFDDGTTVKTMTLINSITSPFSFSISRSAVAPQIASGTALGTYGIYTVTFSYQDIFGNPSATTSVQGVKIKLQQLAEVNSAFATDITKNSATIKGEVDGSGFGTTVRFIYGTDPLLQDASTVIISNPATADGAASGVFSVTANIAGLQGGTVYYYKISADNFLGFGNSSTGSFSTDPSISISAISPQSGPVGSEMIVSGQGFNTAAADNIVYFGAVKGTVVSATRTELKVIVPVGASYQPISVLNKASRLTAYSAKPFSLTYKVVNSWQNNFSKATGWVYAGLKSFSLSDLNGDGYTDILASTREDFAVTISDIPIPSSDPKLVVSGGPFPITKANSNYPLDTLTVSSGTSQQMVAETDVNEVLTSDIDADGRPDLIAANKSGSISITKNNSTGGTVTASSFASRFNIPVSGNVNSIATGDLNMDGKPDIVAVCGNQINVYQNKYNSISLDISSFSLVTQFTGISSRSHITIADVDGDNKPDIIATNGTNVSVYRNTSNNNFSFASRVDFPVGYESFAIATGDIDGDGKLDIAVTTYNASNLLSILKNTSTLGTINTSSFAPKVDILSGSSSELTSVAIGDIDGDGRPDIVTSDWNRFSPSMKLFANTSQANMISSSSFAPYINYYVQSPIKVGIQDMDNDGKLDVVVISDFGTALYYIQHYTGFNIFRNTMRFVPTITKLAPAAAFTGDTVKIIGRGFIRNDAMNILDIMSVQFGGAPATSFSVVSDTLILAVVGKGNSGTVTVNTQDGPASLDGFTWRSVPVISSFTPANAHAGDTVQISGRYFSAVTSVSFGGVSAFSYVVSSDSLIKAVVGQGASGSIAVTTLNGATTIPGFSYLLPVPVIKSFIPATAKKGDTVTIRGFNFTDATMVRFGNIVARSFIVDSANQIRAIVDTGSSGNVSVVTAGGTGVLAGFSYIVLPSVVAAPVITSFSPSSAASGATVIITGTNLAGATAVRFGDVAARSFSINNTGQISAVVDTGASGSIHVTTPGGSAVLAGFTYIKPVVTTIVSFSPLTGTLGTIISIKGTGFTDVTSIRFGDVDAPFFYVNNDSAVNAVVGTGASGNVVVKSPSGTASATGFTYIPPTPTITASGPLTFCEGGSVILTSSVSGYDNLWYRNSVLVADNKTSILKVTSSGSYTVTASNSGFVSAASTATAITVITAPVIAKPTISGFLKDTLVCFTDALALSVEGTYDKYLWSTGETTRAISVTKQGTVSVKVGANNAACYSIDSSIVIDARKNITPVPVLTRPVNDLVSTLSGNYRWTLNNVIISGANTATLPVGSKGVYAVSTSKDNTCWTASADYLVLLDPVTIKKAFDLTSYPNPSNGTFSIQIKFEKTISAVVNITITDQSGIVKLAAKKLLFSDRTIKIPISIGLTKGTYAVRVDVNGEVNTQQMIVL